MRDRIEFLTMEKYDFPVRHDNVFALNTRRKAVWLQRACIWILRKLGCEWTEITSKARRVVIEPRGFMQELHRQRAEIVSQLHGEPAVLLIGSEDFEQMMSTEVGGQSFCFNGEYMMDRRIYGLRVCVLPYLRGMVVIDKRDLT